MNPSEIDAVRFMESRPLPTRPRYALSAAERASLRASGLLTEPAPVLFEYATLKERNRVQQRAALNRAFDEVKARWGMRDLPKGEVKAAAQRHGCDHQLLLNKFYKARMQEAAA